MKQATYYFPLLNQLCCLQAKGIKSKSKDLIQLIHLCWVLYQNISDKLLIGNTAIQNIAGRAVNFEPCLGELKSAEGDCFH